MNKLKLLFGLLGLLFSSLIYGQIELKVYQFYNSEGKQLSYADAVDQLAIGDIALLGELHDHAMVHWIQKRIIADLHAKRQLVLGGEFFERDNQIIIDEYLKGIVNDKRFEEEARLWPNYVTDYKSILQFARDSGLYFVATNVPRRYAAFVAQHGLDTLESLPASSRVYLPKLPIAFSLETPGYSDMLDMMGGHGMSGKATYFVQAQALKDAAMAEAIVQNWTKKQLFVHINGDFHSANYGGIYSYIKILNPKLNVQTLKVYSEKEFVFRNEWAGSGDIILIVPEDFTRTH